MISLIVAYDNNRCIGKNNSIPWKLKSDMLRVRNLTTNQTILMGRKTYDSVGKPLPNRVNRVLTRDFNFKCDGIEIFHDVEKAISDVKTDKLFIFGGEEIYKKLISFADEMYITEVDANIPGDSHFPIIDSSKWKLISKEHFKKDESNEYDYKFLHYIRSKGDEYDRI